MSAGAPATPGATLPKRTPRRPQVRKHGATEAVEETGSGGRIKTGEETIPEISGRLDGDFDRMRAANDGKLEDIIDLVIQLHSVVDHHPDHGDMMTQIGGMQHQIKKCKQACEKKTSAIEEDMKDAERAIDAMDEDRDLVEITEKKGEIDANKDKLIKRKESNTSLDAINFESFGMRAKVLGIIKDGGVAGVSKRLTCGSSSLAWKAKEPMMGGLVETQNREVACCGGKPLPNWTGVQNPLDPNVEDPLPTQLRMMDSKAAVAQPKRAEGICASNEKRFTEKEGNVNDFSSQLFRKLVVNGMEAIAHRNVNAMGAVTASGTTIPADMVNAVENCAPFNRDDIRKQNVELCKKYDRCDKQNDKEATDCLLNSLEETLRKQIGVKMEEEMLFTEAFMLFIETVRPQNSELYVSLEKKITDFDPSKHPGANIKAVVSDLRVTVTSMMRGNACDSKHNVTIARMLTNAGGDNNEEYSIPMQMHLNTVKEEEFKVRHLGNKEKHKAMAQKNVGILDTFRKAEEPCVQQTTDGNARWRPAINMGNADLAQIQPDKSRSNKRFKKKNNFKKKFNRKGNGNRKNWQQKRKTWRDYGPKKGDKPDRCEGKTPTFKRTAKGRDYEWCEKCNEGQQLTTPPIIGTIATRKVTKAKLPMKK